MTLYITTCIDKDESIEKKAKDYMNLFPDSSYVDRGKKTVKQMRELYGNLVLVYAHKTDYISAAGERLFFHPSTAMVRVKNKKDNLLDAVGKRKQRILDCTLGLGTDSLVLSYAGHDVTALESNPIIFEIVKRGFQEYKSGDQKLDLAMQKVKLVQEKSLSFLRKQVSQAYDIVYFDPMFTLPIEESHNLSGIRLLADTSGLDEELLAEAKRVARDKIIIKAHYLDTVFEKYGFERFVRKTAKFHFGIMDMKKTTLNYFENK